MNLGRFANCLRNNRYLFNNCFRLAKTSKLKPAKCWLKLTWHNLATHSGRRPLPHSRQNCGGIESLKIMEVNWCYSHKTKLTNMIFCLPILIMALSKFLTFSDPLFGAKNKRRGWLTVSLKVFPLVPLFSGKPTRNRDIWNLYYAVNALRAAWPLVRLQSENYRGKLCRRRVYRKRL